MNKVNVKNDEIYKEYKIARILNYIVNRNRNNITNDLKHESLTHAEARIILILSHQGCLTQDELAQIMYIDKSAVTRILQKMMDKEFVSKRREKKDRRFQYIELTEKGTQMKERVMRVFDEHNNQMMHGISEEEEIELRTVLEKIGQNIGGSDEFK